MADEPWPAHAESARSPSSAPTPAPRDHEDEDAQLSTSHIQKRPRLDSGSRAVRSLSAGPILSPPPREPTPPPPPPPTNLTPSRITLHVRNIPSSQYEDDSTTAVAPTSSPVDTGDAPGSSESAPIEIRDVEEVTDEMDAIDTIDTIDTIELVDDELVETFIADFPYLDRNPNTKPVQMAKNIMKHLDNEEVDKSLLPLLISWLKAQNHLFANQKHLWRKLFFSHKNLWDQVGHIMSRLYMRG
jgi:hypothetical protein